LVLREGEAVVDEPGHLVVVPGDFVDDDHFATVDEWQVPEEVALAHVSILL